MLLKQTALPRSGAAGCLSLHPLLRSISEFLQPLQHCPLPLGLHGPASSSRGACSSNTNRGSVCCFLRRPFCARATLKIMPGRGPRLAASYKIAWHNEGELELGYIRTCLRHMGGAGAGDHGNGPGARRGHKNQRGKVPQPQTLPSYKTRNSSTVGAQRLWTRAMILGRAPGEASQDKGQTASESAYPIWPGVPHPHLFPSRDISTC